MKNRDILKQYIDIGIPIGRYQFSQLDGNLLNTYLRKRSIMVGQTDSDIYEFQTYELLGAPDNYKDIFINTFIKQMDEYFKECDDLERYEIGFSFKSGDMNPIIGNVLKLGKSSKESDYYILGFLKNEKFLHYLNIKTIQRLLARSFNTYSVFLAMGDIGNKFVNSITSETIIQTIAYSNNPLTRIKIFGQEWLTYFRELKDKDVAYMLMHSGNPSELLEICGDECMSLYKDDTGLVRHAINNGGHVDLLKVVFTSYGINFEGMVSYQ